MTPALAAQVTAAAAGEPVLLDGIDVVSCRIDGKPVQFCVDREQDPIQRNNRLGRFYEAPELRWLGRSLKPGFTFLDIGANIGNHGLYAAMFLGAARVVPIEPNPVAIRLLLANVCLNGLTETFDLTRLGVGLSDRHTAGFSVEHRETNIGGARLIPGTGDIEVHRGDDLFADLTPGAIKIDVEGMEMQVLCGLEETIAQHRPVLLVEVDVSNQDAFEAWTSDRDYHALKTWQRYKSNRNHLLVPR